MTSSQVARATCHNVHCHDSALVPCTAEGMGLPTKEDRLSIEPTVPEMPLKSVTTAGGPAGGPLILRYLVYEVCSISNEKISGETQNMI